ncbi:Saposin-like domain-containing protein [Strongyloides ratti]|uniref:Saposin-like domain-containing protein n=1 Tax=Strongyloides ratti TaxID=34506 RepID=A0A090KXW9_STRRB|nr:Saposin-like domain-containing protein [Strongyloides ratti]CEF62365.1 Saposin-like domain-containing protein [Strongyloides ratti]
MNSYSTNSIQNIPSNYSDQFYNYSSMEMNPKTVEYQVPVPDYTSNIPNASFSFSGYPVYGGTPLSNFSTPSSSNSTLNSSASSDDMCNEYMKYINSCYNYQNFSPHNYSSPLLSNSNNPIVLPSSMSTPPSLDNNTSLEFNSFNENNENYQSNVGYMPKQYIKKSHTTPTTNNYRKKNQIQQQIDSGVYNKCEKIPSYFEACQYVIKHIDSIVINFTMRILMNPDNFSICHWTKYCWEFVITDPDSFVSCFCEEFNLDKNLITIAHVSKVYKIIGSSTVYGQPIIERVKCRRNAFRLFPKHQNFTYPRLKDLGSNSLSTTFLKDEEKKALGKLRKIKTNVPIFSRKRKGSGKNEDDNNESCIESPKQKRLDSYLCSFY